MYTGTYTPFVFTRVDMLTFPEHYGSGTWEKSRCGWETSIPCHSKHTGPFPFLVYSWNRYSMGQSASTPAPINAPPVSDATSVERILVQGTLPLTLTLKLCFRWIRRKSLGSRQGSQFVVVVPIQRRRAMNASSSRGRKTLNAWGLLRHTRYVFEKKVSMWNRKCNMTLQN